MRHATRPAETRAGAGRSAPRGRRVGVAFALFSAPVLLGACGSSPPAGRAVPAAWPALAGAEVGSARRAPPGHRLLRGGAWSVVVPDSWNPVPHEPPVAEMFATPERTLSASVTAVPFGHDAATFAQQAVDGFAAARVLLVARREARAGVRPAIDLEVAPATAPSPVRLLGRIVANATVGVVATCGSPSGYFDAARRLCTSVLGTLRVAAGPPRAAAAMPPGFRALDGAAWGLAVPADWQDQPTDGPGRRSAISRGGGDRVIVVTVGTAPSGGDARTFVQHGVANVARDPANTIVGRRDIVVGADPGVEFESLRMEDGPRLRMLQRYVVRAGVGVVVTCGGAEEVMASERGSCEAVLDSLRVGP